MKRESDDDSPKDESLPLFIENFFIRLAGVVLEDQNFSGGILNP